ncbi:MAG: hypothetical protein JXL80_17330 [Planctomycetes bacterium]|nr:hypothetical protein [Planctomycetota bacterium]
MTGPYDFSAQIQPAPGHEHSLPQLMRLAWARFAANFWPAVGYGLLAIVILVGVALGLGLLCLLFGWLFYLALKSAVAPEVAIILLCIILGVPAYLFLIMAGKLLTEGLLWALMQTYDGIPVTWSAICRSLQPPWGRPMLRYTALFALLTMIITVAQGAMGGVAGAKGIPWLNHSAGNVGIHFALNVVGHIVQGAILTVTLLIGLFILNSHEPSMVRGIEDQIRVLRNQWPRVATIVGLYMAGLFLTQVPQLIMAAMAPAAAPWAGCMALPFLLVRGLLALYFGFLVAALFRSIHGMPLEPTAEPTYYAQPVAAIRPAQPLIMKALPIDPPMPDTWPQLPPTEPPQPPAPESPPQGAPWS